MVGSTLDVLFELKSEGWWRGTPEECSLLTDTRVGSALLDSAVLSQHNRPSLVTSSTAITP